jgi:protein TonB
MNLSTLPKPQDVVTQQTVVEPEILQSAPTQTAIVAENSPPKILKKPTNFPPFISRTHQPVVISHNNSEITPPEPAVIEPTTPVLEPVAQPVTVAKPEVQSIAPVVHEAKVEATPIVEKTVETPDKPTQQPAKKTSSKQITNNVIAAENTAPVLSMDDLAAQIAQVGEKYGNQQPTQSTINETPEKKPSATQNHKLLVRQYSADARHKVERIGNLNYPKSAWQKDFTEKVVIEALISADGGIQSIRVKKTSGDGTIDEAAKNIVQMTAPFAVFPEKLAAEQDSITITFPLRFSDESGIMVR